MTTEPLIIPPDACYGWGPFEIMKAEENKSGTAVKGTIKGIASTEHVDEDGETVIQAGINWSKFNKGGGFLTVEHPASFQTSVGEPTDLRLIEYRGVPATEVTADLYLSDKLGKAVFDKAWAIQKSGGKHRLGFSVEGSADERDPKDRKRILKSTVWSLAITSQPRNRNCRFDPLMASLARATLGKAETADLAALIPQGMTGRDRLMEDLTLLDLAVARLLRKSPRLTWADGKALIEQHLKGLNQ